MKNLALALIALMIAPSLAFAGGGNSKDDPILKVYNGTDSTVLVILDQKRNHNNGNSTSFDEGNGGSQLDEFLAAGGVVLHNRGDSHPFEVKAGSHTVHYLILDDYLPEVQGVGQGGGGGYDIDIDDFETIRTYVFEGQDKKITIRSEIYNPAR